MRPKGSATIRVRRSMRLFARPSLFGYRQLGLGMMTQLCDWFHFGVTGNQSFFPPDTLSVRRNLSLVPSHATDASLSPWSHL